MGAAEQPGPTGAFDRSRMEFEAIIGFLQGEATGALAHGELEDHLQDRGRELLRLHGDPDQDYRVSPAPFASSEGHRIVWVLHHQAAARRGHQRIQRTLAALTDLGERLADGHDLLREARKGSGSGPFVTVKAIAHLGFGGFEVGAVGWSCGVAGTPPAAEEQGDGEL